MLFSDYHQPYHFLSKEDEARASAKRRELPGSSRPSPRGKAGTRLWIKRVPMFNVNLQQNVLAKKYLYRTGI